MINKKVETILKELPAEVRDIAVNCYWIGYRDASLDAVDKMLEQSRTVSGK